MSEAQKEPHVESGVIYCRRRAGAARSSDSCRGTRRSCWSGLGLGDLLARMPAGLHQIVGESGWLLSEGERSRGFLARTLLSRANLLVLDECFSALDSESDQVGTSRAATPRPHSPHVCAPLSMSRTSARVTNEA